jgi:hypothetical protein
MTEQNALVWEGGQIVKVRPVPVPESRPGWMAVDILSARRSRRGYRQLAPRRRNEGVDRAHPGSSNVIE